MEQLAVIKQKKENSDWESDVSGEWRAFSHEIAT